MSNFEHPQEQPLPRHEVPENEAWRKKVVKWNYRLIDHFDEPREIVYVSVNVLDRFALLHPSCWENKETYRLAAMTSLYVAMKRCGRSDWFRARLMTKITRGGVTQEDVSRMERSILSCLPTVPTSMQFMQSMFELLPPSQERQAALESAAFLIEISVCDSFFSLKSPKVLAFAATLQSLETHDIFSEEDEHIPAFLAELERLMGLTPETEEVSALSSRLRRLSARSCEGSDPSVQVIPANDGEGSASWPPITARGHRQWINMSPNGTTTVAHVVESMDDEEDGS